MGLCPVMTRAILLPSVDPNDPQRIKIPEIQCRKEGCEWWHVVPPHCIVSYDCPDCDTGPCGPNCAKAKWTEPAGWCKAVND